MLRRRFDRALIALIALGLLHIAAMGYALGATVPTERPAAAQERLERQIEYHRVLSSLLEAQIAFAQAFGQYAETLEKITSYHAD